MEENEPVEWDAPAYKYRPKGPSWYWISIILTIVLISLAVWQNNFFLVVFLAIAEAMVLFWSRKEPEILRFKIDEKGVALGEYTRYNYADLEGFSVTSGEDYEEFDNLTLKKKNALSPYVKIVLQKNASAKAKAALAGRLNEDSYEESLLDWPQDWIGF